MRDTARAATLALLASAALLPVWVVFGGRIGTDARGAVLDAEARVDAVGTRHDASVCSSHDRRRVIMPGLPTFCQLRYSATLCQSMYGLQSALKT